MCIDYKKNVKNSQSTNITMTMKYLILTEKQCNKINQKCNKLQYCHEDHIKTKQYCR